MIGTMNVFDQFSLNGKIAVVTGGSGVLGGAIALGLAQAGAGVAILGRQEKKVTHVAEQIRSQGGEAIPLLADVLDPASLEAARDKLMASYGHVDILVNCAGGNIPDATILGDITFFNMPRTAFDQVVGLNLTGSLLPSQVFGEWMVKGESGSIINISSMASRQAITRVLGYSVAKAAIDNFTIWLATEFAMKYGERFRVNAIAPGFFIGEQNRSLLLNEDESLTARGQLIVNRTPMKRFGAPNELVGTAIWLASDASRFVTGVVIPVDGGFSAFSGV